MTREMNKPDWHNKWVNKDKSKQRVLNPDVAEFVNELNERLGQK